MANGTTWNATHKSNHQSSCKASAKARTCPRCKRGNAMKLDKVNRIWLCRYCSPKPSLELVH